MTNPIEIAAQCASRFTNVTLNDMRYEAAAEKAGVTFHSLREQSGPQLMIAICVTDAEFIKKLEGHIEFGEDGARDDWGDITVAELLMRAGAAGSVVYEDFRASSGERIALALAAVDPDGIALLGSIFEFPD